MPLKQCQILQAKYEVSRNSTASKVSIKCPCSIIKMAKARIASMKYIRLVSNCQYLLKGTVLCPKQLYFTRAHLNIILKFVCKHTPWTLLKSTTHGTIAMPMLNLYLIPKDFGGDLPRTTFFGNGLGRLFQNLIFPVFQYRC